MVRLFLRIPVRFYLFSSVLILLTAAFSSIWIQHARTEVSADFSPASYVFVLDAGHGGEDGGATTADGVRESGINLAVTLKLDDLSHLLGLRTVLVRSTDTAVYSSGCQTFSEKKVSDLHNRARLVNETAQGFLVSIHQNQFPESKYSGAQVFYNSVAPAEHAAKTLQADLIAFLDPSNNRQAKSASETIFLMREITKPGILVECGFLSNPQEAAKLQESEYQTKLALVIASALYELSPKETQENEI